MVYLKMMSEVVMEHLPSATTVIMAPMCATRDVMGAAMDASASHRLTPTSAPAWRGVAWRGVAWRGKEKGSGKG
jgi:hypothetical protein